MVAIKIHELSNGERNEFSGKYVREYNPAPRTEPCDPDEFVHLVCVDTFEEALHFDSLNAAIEFYRSPSGRTRPDGSLDRPLTAYTAEFEEDFLL